jgi:hypothetical protein
MVDLSSKEQHALRDLYCNLMIEVRERIDIIHDISQGRYRLPKLAGYELCYLQFRLICELIALSALAAHGDIQGTKSGRLPKSYEADFILNTLEKLHPDFYPIPSTQVHDAHGRVIQVDPIKSGFLTKKELIALYHQTGDLLHRGTMRNYKPRTAGDFRKISETVSKIVTLLNHHQIQLSHPDYQLWVVMRGKGDGLVHASVFQKFEGPPPTD